MEFFIQHGNLIFKDFWDIDSSHAENRMMEHLSDDGGIYIQLSWLLHSVTGYNIFS